MERRTLLAVGALLWASACGASSPESARSEPERGPVILFLVDTLRADHLGCYGYGRDTSPALDELVADGVVFEECQAQSSWTKPATASILTGLLPSVHRAVHKVAALPPEHMLLAEPLLAAGYDTAAFGANGFIFGPEQGFGRGFERFESGIELVHGASGKEHVRADVLVDAALDWLAEDRGDAPPFLYMHAVDPHDPYDPLPELRNRFTQPLGEGQPTDAELERPGPVKERFGGTIPPKILERMEGLYDAEILAADQALGRLIAGLKSAGLYDAATIVFVADHGEEFLEHGRVGHNPALFQEVTHVPLVIKFPFGLAPEAQASLRGRRFSERVRQVDVLPTVLDAVGVELNGEERAKLAGSSLLPSLLDPDGSGWSVPAVTEVDYEGAYRKSLIAGGLKYVRSWAPEVSEQLYDLNLDPDEREDLSGADPGRLEGMRSELGRLATTSGRGWTISFRNHTAARVAIAGLITYEGEDLGGLDPLNLEFEAADPLAVDGPVGQGWIKTELTEGGRGRIAYGQGPSLEQADLVPFPELPLGELGAYQGRAAWFFASLEPSGEDGVAFVPSDKAKTPRLMLWAGGQVVPPEFVVLGPGLIEAEAMPLTLGTGEGLELPGPPPMSQGPEGRPLFAWIWKNLDPKTLEVELSAETEANLRGLGYFGDE